MQNERWRRHEGDRVGGEGEQARPEVRVCPVYTRAQDPEAISSIWASNTWIIYDTRAPIKQSLNSFVYAGEARHVAALIYGRTTAVCVPETLLFISGKATIVDVIRALEDRPSYLENRRLFGHAFIVRCTERLLKEPHIDFLFSINFLFAKFT